MSMLDHRIDLPEWKEKSDLAERLVSGEQIEKVPAGSISSVFVMRAVKLFSDSVSEVILEAGLKYQYTSREKKDIVLVVSVEGSGQDFWKAFPLSREAGAADWQYAFIRKTMNRQDHLQGKIKAYLLNNSDVPALIQGFWVDIYPGNPGKK
jgi:hypothetical protein